jgi:hypothetical protein
MANHTTHSVQREISIFWDYENVPLPTWCSATQAAKAIVDAVSQYGRIVDRRLYYDFEKMRYRPRDCSSLDSSGFDLVNTPTRNNKETLDKKLIADVLTFAWDSAVRNDNKKPCVVLLTGDGDYAYTLSKLRDRGIMTVVMVGQDCTVASILVDTADVAMSLEDDVLCDIAKTSNSALISQSRQGSRATSSLSSPKNDGKEDLMMLTICRSVQNRTERSADGWIDFGQIALVIQQHIRKTMQNAPPEVIKEHAKAARQKAETSGFIEIGRRKLDSKNAEREIIASNDRSLNLSSELYTRLLLNGEKLLQGNFSPTKQDAKTPSSSPTATNNSSPKNRTEVLFLPRLPSNTNIRGLVKFLEDRFHVTVRRAKLEGLNATVEFANANDAGVVLKAASKSTGGEGIRFRGKSMGALSSRSFDHLESKGGKDIYYEIENEKVVPSRKPVTSMESNIAAHADTSDDTKVFCHAVYLDASRARKQIDSWVSSASVVGFFRSHLPPEYLNTASKEDISTRQKEARATSIQEGFIEVGRRDLSSKDKTYVPVALDGVIVKSEPNLSPEFYFRLLPPGLALAIEAKKSLSQPESQRNKNIFLSNLPISTTATQLVPFLNAMECQVQRIELEVRALKQGSVMGAHVECVSTHAATKLLRKANKSRGGIVFCGRNVYAVPDRATLNQTDDRPGHSIPSDLIYVREGSPITTSSSGKDVDLLDDSVPSDVTTEVEEPEVILIDNSEYLMRQDSGVSDQVNPFQGIEDLLSWT